MDLNEMKFNLERDKRQNQIEREILQNDRELLEKELIEQLDKTMAKLKKIIKDAEEEIAYKPTFFERVFGRRK